MSLLIYFVILLFAFKNKKSVATFLIFIQIISLCGIFFIGKDIPINTSLRFFNVIFTGLILTLLILPWYKMNNIEKIYTFNEIKVKKLTLFLLVVSAFTFVILLITSILVNLAFDDVNAFKYAEGVSKDFYYNLPINVKVLILSTYLYYFSYFLIPLHFYYLGKKKYRIAILCFIFSLNIILHGLTYFSRAALTEYILVYISFYIMLSNTLNTQVKRNIKKIIVTLGILATFYFAIITINRFTNDKIYENLIPAKALIQDPVLYSVFDYLSQWYYNNLYVLDSYNYKIFNGQTSLEPILNLLGQYGFVDYNPDAYLKLRKVLWPDHWYTFNGFVAYSVYDYGYLITLFISIFYYLLVTKLKPRKTKITLLNLFSLVLLIQIPLLSIFYSSVSIIIIPFLLFAPIFLYLKTKKRNNINR